MFLWKFRELNQQTVCTSSLYVKIPLKFNIMSWGVTDKRWKEYTVWNQKVENLRHHLFSLSKGRGGPALVTKNHG